jgi:hypothetical protein
VKNLSSFASEATAVKKLLAFAALALAVPSLALAAKPPSPANSQGPRGKSAPQVTYVLRGQLVAFTAANANTNGTVSILVNSSNHHGAALKGKTLQFNVSSSTRVVVRSGGALQVLDKGIVKVRGPKKLGPNDDLQTTLQALIPRQVIDQRPAS